MTKFKDKSLALQGNTEDDNRDFLIAQLNRRVENLEAIVFELLRDKVPYEIIDGYLSTVEANKTFTPNSMDLKERGRQFADIARKNLPAKNLAWPDQTIRWPR